MWGFSGFGFPCEGVAWVLFLLFGVLGFWGFGGSGLQRPRALGLRAFLGLFPSAVCRLPWVSFALARVLSCRVGEDLGFRESENVRP